MIVWSSRIAHMWQVTAAKQHLQVLKHSGCGVQVIVNNQPFFRASLGLWKRCNILPSIRICNARSFIINLYVFIDSPQFHPFTVHCIYDTERFHSTWRFAKLQQMRAAGEIDAFGAGLNSDEDGEDRDIKVCMRQSIRKALCSITREQHSEMPISRYLPSRHRCFMTVKFPALNFANASHTLIWRLIGTGSTSTLSLTSVKVPHNVVSLKSLRCTMLPLQLST